MPSSGSLDALDLCEGGSDRDTEVPLTQPASRGSRKLASFAQRFRLDELNQQRKQKQASLEDCIPADLPRDERLSRPLLCDVPLVLASSAEVGIGSCEIGRLAEMDACSALMSLGGTSNSTEQQNVPGLSSSRLLVHFSTPRPDSFPLSVSYSSERMAATRVGLLEDEQDSFAHGGGGSADRSRSKFVDKGRPGVGCFSSGTLHSSHGAVSYGSRYLCALSFGFERQRAYAT